MRTKPAAKVSTCQVKRPGSKICSGSWYQLSSDVWMVVHVHASNVTTYVRRERDKNIVGHDTTDSTFGRRDNYKESVKLESK